MIDYIFKGFLLSLLQGLRNSSILLPLHHTPHVRHRSQFSKQFVTVCRKFFGNYRAFLIHFLVAQRSSLGFRLHIGSILNIDRFSVFTVIFSKIFSDIQLRLLLIRLYMPA